MQPAEHQLLLGERPSPRPWARRAARRGRRGRGHSRTLCRRRPRRTPLGARRKASSGSSARRTCGRRRSSGRSRAATRPRRVSTAWPSRANMFHTTQPPSASRLKRPSSTGHCASPRLGLAAASSASSATRLGSSTRPSRRSGSQVAGAGDRGAERQGARGRDRCVGRGKPGTAFVNGPLPHYVDRMGQWARLCGRFTPPGGKANTYLFFAEHDDRRSPAGWPGWRAAQERAALTSRRRSVFHRLVRDGRIVELHDMINGAPRRQSIFPDVAGPERFALVALAGPIRTATVSMPPR